MPSLLIVFYRLVTYEIILYRIILEVLEILKRIFWKFWIFCMEHFQKSWKTSGIRLTVLLNSSFFLKRWCCLPSLLVMFYRLVTYDTILYRIILEVLEILEGIFWKFWIFFIEWFQKSWNVFGILPVSSKNGVKCLVCLLCFTD